MSIGDWAGKVGGEIIWKIIQEKQKQTSPAMKQKDAVLYKIVTINVKKPTIHTAQIKIAYLVLSWYYLQITPRVPTPSRHPLHSGSRVR